MGTTATTYLSCAETAKLLRAALKSQFPGVKFSVRSSTYSMGASIDVSWVDGPRGDAVDKVASIYAGATFDGMIDLKSYHKSLLRGPDGDVQEVHFGADFVFVHRTISDAWRAGIFELFARTIGRELGDPEDYNFWTQRVPLAVDRLNGKLYRMVETDQTDIRDVFHQFTGAREGGSLEDSVAAL